MNSKERVLAALSHREPDRVPIDFGGTNETTIHVKAYQQLKEYLGICVDKPVQFRLLTAQIVDVDEEIQNHVGSDVRGVFPNAVPLPSENEWKDEEYYYRKDEFGIGWRKPIEEGLYYDMYDHPLREKEEEEIEKYPLPDPRRPERFDGINEKIEKLSKSGAYPVVFDNCFGNGIFQTCNHLMGYDEFMVSLALGEKKAEILLDKIVELKMEFWDEVLTRFGSSLDVVKELDDLGTQTSLLISPDMYDTYIKPRLSRLLAFIKKKAPHVKIMMHSCGSIRGVIGSLIDAGVEILNPVQYSAENMDPVELKKEFGKDLVFWGGGVDTQNILNRGTVEDVRKEVRRMLDILMPGGGFVFAQVHNIQYGVPPENMVAMWETVREYGVY
ncbi:MAG: uroporphyrinogen decarboxylase family protein [Spirochaetales bacterium]